MANYNRMIFIETTRQHNQYLTPTVLELISVYLKIFEVLLIKVVEKNLKNDPEEF